MNRFMHMLESIIRGICALMLAAFVCLVSLDVASREIFNAPMFWTVDVVLGLFVWSVFLGAAVGVQQRAHFTVDIVRFQSRNAEFALQIITQMLMLFFIILVLIYGALFSISGYNQFSMMVGFRRVYVFSAIPVSAFFMLLFTVGNIINLIQNRSTIPVPNEPTLSEANE